MLTNAEWPAANSDEGRGSVFPRPRLSVLVLATVLVCAFPGHSHGVVENYPALQTWSSSGYGILRSTDAGRTWTPVLRGTGAIDALLVAAKGTMVTGTAGYLGGPGMTFGIYRSSDAGERWAPAEVPFGKAHPDIRAFLSLESGTMIAAGNGVFSSSDSGITWKMISDGVSITVLEKTSTGTLLAGTYDGVMRSTDQGATWVRAGLPGKSVLCLLSGSSQLLAGTDKGLFRSKDGGTTWSVSTSNLPHKWIGALSSSGDDTIYASLPESGVFGSKDGGRNWKRLLALGDKTSTFALQARAKGEVFASAATCCPVDTVSLFHSLDTGLTWRRLLDLKGDRAIGAIRLNDEGTIFLGLSSLGE